MGFDEVHKSKSFRLCMYHGFIVALLGFLHRAVSFPLSSSKFLHTGLHGFRMAPVMAIFS